MPVSHYNRPPLLGSPALPRGLLGVIWLFVSWSAWDGPGGSLGFLFSSPLVASLLFSPLLFSAFLSPLFSSILSALLASPSASLASSPPLSSLLCSSLLLSSPLLSSPLSLSVRSSYVTSSRLALFPKAGGAFLLGSLRPVLSPFPCPSGPVETW